MAWLAVHKVSAPAWIDELLELFQSPRRVTLGLNTSPHRFCDSLQELQPATDAGIG